MSSGVPPTQSNNFSVWGTFSPISKEFKKAEQVFHELTWWQQAIVVIASSFGGLFFIVGAFPTFYWTTHWIKPGQDTQADKTSETTKNFFQETAPKILDPTLSPQGTSPSEPPKILDRTPSPEPPKQHISRQGLLDTKPEKKPSKPPLAQPTTSTSSFQDWEDKSYPFPSVTFSHEIANTHKIPWIFTQKYADEKSKRFEPLFTFLQSLAFDLRFDPPIDFKKITVFELIQGAMLIAQGHFSRSDNISSWDDPIIQIKMFQVLDPLMVELYQDNDLPLLLKEEMKWDYLYRVRCLFEHSSRIFIKSSNEKEWLNRRNHIDTIAKDPNMISASHLLELFDQSVKNQSIPKNITLKMYSPSSHMGTGRCHWVLKGLFKNIEHKGDDVHNIFLLSIKDVFLEMEKIGNNRFVQGLCRLDFDYDKDMFRINETIYALYNQNPKDFRNKFETVFPEENFEKYKEKFANSYDRQILSENPILFEIPLLAEAFQVKVDCYTMDKEGNFTVTHLGPQTAASTLTLAFSTRDPYFNACRL